MNDVNKVSPLSPERLSEVVSFGLTVQNLCSTIAAAGLRQYFINPTLLFELVNKLPATLKLEWARELERQGPEAEGNLEIFNTWLFSVAQSASRVTPVAIPSETKKEATTTGSTRKQNSRRSNKETVGAHNSEEEQCKICKNGNHKVPDCEKFINLSSRDRWKEIHATRLCGICFGDHFYRRCPNKKRCNVDECRLIHHPLLHFQASTPEDTRVEELHTHNERNHTIFRIVPILVRSGYETKLITAFLDEGSSVTLMDEGLANELKLEGKMRKLHLRWTGDVTRNTDSMEVVVEVSNPSGEHAFAKLTNVRTIPNLNLPLQGLDVTALKKAHPEFEDLPLCRLSNHAPANANRARALQHYRARYEQGKQGQAADSREKQTRMVHCRQTGR